MKILPAMVGALWAHQSYAEDAAWPYPDDIPKVENVSVGLAGEKPADISRFLLAQGASNGELNADGSLLAYRSRVTGVRQVWVKPSEGGAARQLTFGKGVTFFRWHPDGKHILYGSDNDGDEREAYYLISADGMTERKVLASSHAFRRFSEFTDGGKGILFASTERNGLDFDVYHTDLASGETKMLLEGSFGYFPAAKQPGGDFLLITDVRGEDGHDVYMLNTATGDLKPLFKPEISAEYSSFVWAPDGKSFYYLSNDDRAYLAVMHYDLASATSKMIAAGDYDFEDLEMSGDGNYLSYSSNEGGYSKIHVLDRSSLKPIDQPTLPHGMYRTEWANEGASLAIDYMAPSTPGDIYAWAPGGDTKKVVAANLAGLNPADMIAPEPITFEARDGLTVHGLLYMPQGVEKPAIVVDVHGGPTSQARPTWQPLTQYLIGKGIAVLDINVRGSTGYGKEYARLDNKEKRLDSVRDLADAVAWMRADGRVDADRAAVMGGSYGGYAVNAVMGSYPEAFAAGASFVGVSDWVRALQDASPALKASDREEYGDIREKKWQDFYAVNSPINNAHKIKAPMFFEHGKNDPRDPVTETDRIVKAIRDNGYAVEYLRFPDEGHSVSKMPNRITMFRRLARFLETHLGE
ncbi:MAG: prolyl oligopeptidase family serine peptidase [Kordiimonas sp.]